MKDKVFLRDNDVELKIPNNVVILSIKEFCFELKPITKNRTHFECKCKKNYNLI